MRHKTCTKRSDGTDIPECEMKELKGKEVVSEEWCPLKRPFKKGS